MKSSLSNFNVLFSLITLHIFLNTFQVIQCRTLLVRTTPSSPLSSTVVGLGAKVKGLFLPKIDKIDITSNIQFRYAKTVVKANIKNPSITTAQEVKFQMVLPNTAFISNFTIQIKGEEELYVAKVAEKEEAQESYNEAISRGHSAGIVDADTRDVNQITVRSNLKPGSKMEFTLVYEELLKRHISRYEHIIHVHPGQIVEDYKVNIYINESLPIANIKVPELKTSENEITSLLEDNKVAHIQEAVDGDPRKAHIQFSPSVPDQKRMSKIKTKNNDFLQGMAGQFIVQYDVDRKNQGSDIQVLDGYFVHFFAPDYLKSLPKHVVFVLDVSGSMYGTKLVQLKDAMMTVLDDLSEQDYFNILTFSNRVQHWKPTRAVEDMISLPETWKTLDAGLSPNVPQPITKITEDDIKLSLTNRGTRSIIKEARKYVLNLDDGGGTNINDALLEAIKVAENVRISETIPSNTKPMIIFLTDGEATSGITDNQQIKSNVLEANDKLDIPIYGLAFGTGADFNLIKQIGTESGAFARRIYEASDAAIQLEDFYAEISSPLLSNVTFDYVGEAFKNKTNRKLNTFFKGGEYVIAGKLDYPYIQDYEVPDDIEIVIHAQGSSSAYNEKIIPCEPIPMPKLIPVQYASENQIDGNSSLYVNRTELLDIDVLSLRPCIPWPVPPHLPHPNFDPQVKKSEAENFIERLWAYLTIENLLDEKVAKSEIENMRTQGNNVTEEHLINITRGNEDKALKIALGYNFVTKLTSLVVIQPDGNNTEDTELANGTVVNPMPLDIVRHRPHFKSSYRSFSPRIAYGGRMGPSGPQGSLQPQGNIMLMSASYPISRRKGGHRGRGRMRKTMTSYDRQRLGNCVGVCLYHSRQSNNLSFQTATASPTIVETTTFTPSPHDCQIKLFSKTYLRGTSLTLNSTMHLAVPKLSAFSFDDQLSSLQVIGPCCWDIFENADFMGYEKRFNSGEYKSSTMLGADLAKEASSLRATGC